MRSTPVPAYREGQFRATAASELIQIVDDGCGMSPMDARMAFDRSCHEQDRFGRGHLCAPDVRLPGRGARVDRGRRRRSSCARGRRSDEVGTLDVGQRRRVPVSQEPRVLCPAGSQFYVRNLFYNVPARRRFLEKSTDVLGADQGRVPAGGALQSRRWGSSCYDERCCRSTGLHR